MKKILSFILSALILLPAFCEDRIYIINSFSGGLNSHTSPQNTADNQATELLNVRFNKKYSELGNRSALYTNIDFGTGSIGGLYRYYKSDGTVKTVAAIGTLLRADFSGTATTIMTGLTDSKKWQFVVYKDKLIGGNGSDKLVKYDGHTQVTADTDASRTASELCAELGAPFAELNTGTNLDASKWYQYKVAFYDGANYSYSTAKSNPILTGANVHNIYLTDIPIGPTGTTHRYIYRTLGGADQATVEADTTYYMVKDLADNTTKVWADALADDDADADNAPTWGTASAGENITPPLGYILTIHSDRLFVAGNPTNPSEFYFSDDRNPDYFDSAAFEAVRDDDGDKITFLKPFGGILNIGKTNSIQHFYTEGATTSWYSSDVLSFIGSPAPFSVSVCPYGIIYLGRWGIYMFNGNTATFLSDAVTPQINDISRSSVEEASGYYFNNEYYLAYSSLTTGSSYNDRVLMYDFVRGAFSLDSQNIKCFAAYTSPVDGGLLYTGTSTTDGTVTSQSLTINTIDKRYLSDLNAGTYNHTAYVSDSTENNPALSLGWNGTIASWDDYGSTLATLPNGTVLWPYNNGTWTSPVYQVNATTLDKIYWNEQLNNYGNVDFYLRCNSTSNMTGVNWSAAMSNPSGSDISAVTANSYLQVYANFTSSNISYSPEIYQADGYLFRIKYNSVGNIYETTVPSYYQTGWKNFDIPFNKKWIKRIRVFYTGDSGTLTIGYNNDEGDVSGTFNIDMNVSPSFSVSDDYFGTNDNKYFTYYTPANSETTPAAIGTLWQFSITEGGVSPWTIQRIEILYEVQDII